MGWSGRRLVSQHLWEQRPLPWLLQRDDKACVIRGAIPYLLPSSSSSFSSSSLPLCGLRAVVGEVRRNKPEASTTASPSSSSSSSSSFFTAPSLEGAVVAASLGLALSGSAEAASEPRDEYMIIGSMIGAVIV